MSNLNILSFIEYYLPGYKAGGPIRTLVNMADMLGDGFQFKIVTMNHDFCDTKPYSGIVINSWNKVGKAQVFYMSPDRRSLRNLRRLLCSTQYDVLYLNSFFSPHFTIKLLLLRRLRLIPDRRLVIAPRGEFSPGALGLKRLKKLIYLTVAKAVGLYRGVHWHASSENERDDISRWFGSKSNFVTVAPDLSSPVPAVCKSGRKSGKAKGLLKIIFLSRVSRKKNLDGALNILKDIKGDIEFDIYGPLEDKAYWAACQKIMQKLPSNITASYKGPVSYDKVPDIFANYHLLFLPTHGENFCHVVLESLSSGCPVLISDQTPWRDLESNGCGWALPLNAPETFKEVITRCVHMDSFEHAQLVKQAYQFSAKARQNGEIVLQNREIFLKVLN